MKTEYGTPIVAERLHELRSRRGLTVQQMADLCGLPKRSLENYMNVTSPQRPGLDALIAISDGMDVSLDWLVGKAADSLSPRLTRKDYSMACFSVVSRLLNWMTSEQQNSPAPIIQSGKIAGVETTELAAKVMMDFVERVDLFDDTAESHGAGRADLFDGLRTRLRPRGRDRKE